MMENEFSFLSPTIGSKDRALFGFDDGDEIFIDDNWILAHIMHLSGVFPSVSIARKNGWNKPIPKGFSEFTVGKSRKKVWILNEFKDLGDTISLDKPC